MALNFSASIITGLAADQKPTNVPVGITFYETDTGNTWYWSGTAWMNAFLSVGLSSPMGYGPGVGGTVTQTTNKSTGVTLHKLCGRITTHGAALAAGAIVTFTVTNNLVLANDVIVAMHQSGGTLGAYAIVPNNAAAGSFAITLRNNTAGSLSQALVIAFVVIRAATT